MLSRETIRAQARQRERRKGLFLAGPIPFGWILANIPDPASRLTLVARAYMDMEKVTALALSRKIWASANIVGKDARHRVLRKLGAQQGDFEVVSQPGKCTLLRCRETQVQGAIALRPGATSEAQRGSAVKDFPSE